MADRVEKKRRGRGHYSEEFKRRAVEMMAAGDRTLKSISGQLGVSVVTLIKWRRDLQELGSRRGLTPEGGRERDLSGAMTEIERLRVELARVTDERDRLRKSLALLIGTM